MRVEYTFRDKIDTYSVEAEVNGSRVQILTITDSYGTDIDFDDFSEDERKVMKGLALGARDELESQELEDGWNDDEDETEDSLGY